MGELKILGDLLDRLIGEIARELDRQRDKTAGLSRNLRDIVEKAERYEEENAKLKKQLEENERQHAKEMADLTRQQK